MKKVIVEHGCTHFNKSFVSGDYYVTASRLIVLCTKTTNGDFEGVVVSQGSDSCFHEGYTSTAWNGDNFLPFIGKITIVVT